jgi:4-hydroxybenzoate polyprenyltransferase
MAKSNTLPRWDPGRLRRGSRLHALMRLIRIEHTLFSLPFAYAGAFLASPRWALSPKVTVLIAVAVFGLRTAAMAYNNIADLDIDRLNPRTASRPLVTGAVSLRDAWLLVALGSILYYAAAALLNKYTLILSPLLWIIAITYPHAKRYHWLPHLHLGFVLGLTVFGGAVAAYGMQASSLENVIARVPWLLVVAVTLWVSGFDTYYAVMDLEFDRRMGLGSIPAKLGPGRALWASRIQHLLTAALLAAAIPAYHLGPIAAAGAATAILLLSYQHYLLAKHGLQAIPKAFNVNLAIGLIVGLLVITDILVSTL